MATFGEVIAYLGVGKEFYGYGETYEDIIWVNGEPEFTKQEFLDAFEQLDAIKAQKKAEVEAKLSTLGLTIEDIRRALS